MAVYYSKKGLFGGFKFRVEGAIDFLASSKFAGDFFKIMPESTGVYVSSLDGSLSQTYECVEHKPENNFFVCRHNWFKHMGDELYAPDMLCDTLTGRCIELDKETENFVVDTEGNIFFIENGSVALQPFAEKAYKKDYKDYADKNGKHIVTMSKKGEISVVSGRGEYILKNISSDPLAQVTLSKVPLPTSELTLVVKDSNQNVIMTEKGIMYNAPTDKFLSACTHGDEFYTSLFDSVTQRTSVSICDSKTGQTHQLEVDGSVYDFEHKKGDDYIFYVSTEDGDKTFAFNLPAKKSEPVEVISLKAETSESDNELVETQNNDSKPKQLGDA